MWAAISAAHWNWTVLTALYTLRLYTAIRHFDLRQCNTPSQNRYTTVRGCTVLGRFRKTRYFISGLMAGVLISALLMGGALYYSSRQDYVVMVNTHNLVHQVEDVAGVMLAEMLPQYMEEYRSKIPDLVSRQTGSPFADAKFQVGGVDFALPPDLVEELDRQYIDSLTQAVSDLLD